AVFLAGLAATTLIGAWVTGDWILGKGRLSQGHPRYLLPTVAAAQIAPPGAAALGPHPLALRPVRAGAVRCVVPGSVHRRRLFTQPGLPPALLPTMAIEAASAAVASDAWFSINGGRPGPLALMLGGYVLLMVMVQLRLVPAFLRAP